MQGSRQERSQDVVCTQWPIPPRAGEPEVTLQLCLLHPFLLSPLFPALSLTGSNLGEEWGDAHRLFPAQTGASWSYSLALKLCLQHPMKEVEAPELGAGQGASKWLLSPQTMARVFQAMSWLQLNAPGQAPLTPDIRSHNPTPSQPP